MSILTIVICILVFNFILGRWLDYLDFKKFSDTLPESLSGFYDADKYKKSRQYHLAHDRLNLYSDILGFASTMLFIGFGGFAWLNTIMEPYFKNEIWLALAYFGVLSVASGVLGLPFSLYNTFIIEEKYGFNRTTLATFITDKLKGIAISLVLGAGLGYLFLWLILSNPGFWVYAWMLGIVVTLLLNMFYTSVIVPLFNKLSPLPEGELLSGIKKYADLVQFPLTKIMVINGSKRSSKANAFFSGMGRNKKIVLYDTLIEKHTNEELIAILAHEVGHYKKKHIVLSMFLSWIQMGFMLWLLSWFISNTSLSEAFGVHHLAIHINLIVFGILYEPISMLSGIFMNWLSRKNEYEADAFAVETADKEAFKNALIRLSVENLSNLTPHPLNVFLNYSHPTLLQRLKAIDDL